MHRIPLAEIARADAVDFITIPESERRVIRIRMNGSPSACADGGRDLSVSRGAGWPPYPGWRPGAAGLCLALTRGSNRGSKARVRRLGG